MVLRGAVERFVEVVLGHEPAGDGLAGRVLELAAGGVDGEVDDRPRGAGDSEAEPLSSILGIEGSDEVDADALTRAGGGRDHRHIDHTVARRVAQLPQRYRRSGD